MTSIEVCVYNRLAVTKFSAILYFLDIKNFRLKRQKFGWFALLLRMYCSVAYMYNFEVLSQKVRGLTLKKQNNNNNVRRPMQYYL